MLREYTSAKVSQAKSPGVQLTPAQALSKYVPEATTVDAGESPCGRGAGAETLLGDPGATREQAQEAVNVGASMKCANGDGPSVIAWVIVRPLAYHPAVDPVVAVIR